MISGKKIRNYFLPHKASTPDEFIISALINGVILGIGLAVGNALAIIIEKRYFPELARATALTQQQPLHPIDRGYSD